MPYFGATGTPYFGLLVTSPLGLKARVGSASYAFAEANEMYVPQDPPLVPLDGQHCSWLLIYMQVSAEVRATVVPQRPTSR